MHNGIDVGGLIIQYNYCSTAYRDHESIIVHHKLQASQIYFNVPHFYDHVLNKLQGSNLGVSTAVLQIILIPAQFSL